MIETYMYRMSELKRVIEGNRFTEG